MIGIITASMVELRCFLDMIVEIRAIENIGPTVSASGTVEPVTDMTNDDRRARIAMTKNLFMQIEAQIAQMMQMIQPISSADVDCKNAAGVMSEQITAALLKSIAGEAGDEKNPLLATLIFNF